MKHPENCSMDLLQLHHASFRLQHWSEQINRAMGGVGGSWGTEFDLTVYSWIGVDAEASMTTSISRLTFPLQKLHGSELGSWKQDTMLLSIASEIQAGPTY